MAYSPALNGIIATADLQRVVSPAGDGLALSSDRSSGGLDKSSAVSVFSRNDDQIDSRQSAKRFETAFAG
jgi:hypothetical protein